jgi:hypothetical protein
MTIPDDDSDECPAPPDAQRVARRALVLSAIVCRSNSDHDPANPDAIDLWNRLKAWIDSQDVASEIEPSERDMIYAPLGTLDNTKRIRATWRAEGLAILAWALGRCPFPPYGQKVDPYEVTDSLMFLNEEAGIVIQEAQLRPRAELDACRELLYAIHCRLREFQRRKKARSIAHWIEPTWLEVLGVESPLAPRGDLRVGDVPIADAAEGKVNEYEWAVHERHRAAIWLVGEEGPSYSEFTVDT